ncbi:hypothetical protein AB0I54_35580 [Streptomyces sp. NPDC050625]
MLDEVVGAPAIWGSEQAVTVTDIRRYGKATAQAWDPPGSCPR